MEPHKKLHEVISSRPYLTHDLINKLYGFLYYVTGKEKDARGIITEVLTSLTENSLYQYKQNLFKKAVDHVFIYCEKKNAWRREDEFSEGEYGMEFTENSIPDEKTFQTMVFEDNLMISALQIMPDSDRVILLLKDFAGLSLMEIANIMTMPLSNIINRIADARNLLLSILYKMKA